MSSASADRAIATSDGTFRVVPMTVPGPESSAPGWLLRVPAGVVFLAPGGYPNSHRLVDMCRRAESSWALVGQVLSALAGDSDGIWPPFALVAGTNPEPTLIVAGDVPVTIGGVVAPAALAGWSVLHPPFDAAIGLGTSPYPWMVQGGTDLGAGLVAASGALLLPPEAAPRPSDPDGVADPDGDVDHDSGLDLDGNAVTTSAPVSTPAVSAGASAEGTTPPASAATAGEPADARDTADSDAAASAVTTAVPVGGHSKAAAATGVGVLVWDSGRVEPLAGDLIFGRAPEDDPRVADGSAEAWTPDGNVDGLSRVHAELQLDGHQVTLVDRGSTNGTFVWEAGAAQWRRLAPGEGQRLSPGMTFAVAERTCTFEAAGDEDRTEHLNTPHR